MPALASMGAGRGLTSETRQMAMFSLGGSIAPAEALEIQPR